MCQTYKCQISLNEFSLTRAFDFPPIKFPVFFRLGQNRILKKPVPFLRDLPMPIGRFSRPNRGEQEKCQIMDHHPVRIITSSFRVNPIISLSPDIALFKYLSIIYFLQNKKPIIAHPSNYRL